MNWQDHIEQRSGVMLGKPVFKGTRLTVAFVLERLADGATHADLIANYDGLSEDRIRAALDYAAAVLQNETAVVRS
jgi:uncharacterized protein (DUF433 family)